MQVERWDVLEIAVKGPAEGNPFVEQTFEGTFTGKNETITTAGFYDGDGVYKVRFMPSFEGEYTYKTTGSFPEAETQGSFTVTPATGNNHGPVRVANKHPFAYEDGVPYSSMGTTRYAGPPPPAEAADAGTVRPPGGIETVIMGGDVEGAVLDGDGQAFDALIAVGDGECAALDGEGIVTLDSVIPAA